MVVDTDFWRAESDRLCKRYGAPVIHFDPADLAPGKEVYGCRGGWNGGTLCHEWGLASLGRGFFGVNWVGARLAWVRLVGGRKKEQLGSGQRLF
jgi:hypothetical protein